MPHAVSFERGSRQLPRGFKVNKGQTDPRFNFFTQRAGYTT